MPQKVVVTETYWCPGGWPWEWFDTCKRQVTKWCYNFSWVEETGYLLASHLKACENGVEYSWWAFSFNIFGSTYYGPGQMCFSSLLSVDGKCAGTSVAGLTVSADVPRMQALARSRVRGPIHHELNSKDDLDRQNGEARASESGNGADHKHTEQSGVES